MLKSKFFVGVKIIQHSLGLVVLLVMLQGCSFQGISEMDKQLTGEQSRFYRALFKEELERLVEDDFEVPVDSDAHYAFLRADIAYNKGEYEEALKYYEEAAKLENAPAPTLRKRLAQLYVKNGKIESALAQINLILVNQPENRHLLELKAGILSALDRSDEAVDVYRKIITLNDKPFEDVYILLASLLAQNKRLEEGIATLKELNTRIPDSVFGKYYIARMYEAHGAKDLAEKNYKEALKLNPASNAIKLDYARCLGKIKRYEEALSLCSEVIKSNSNNLLARNLRAQLLLVQNKLAEAQKELEDLGPLQEDSTSTQFKIALIKYERGDIEGAITDLGLLLVRNPDYSAARYYLAMAYSRQGRMEDAADQLDKVAPSEPNYVQAKIHQAFLLKQADNANKASEVLEKAISNNDQNIQLLVVSASLLYDIGEIRKAIKRIEQAIEISPDDDKLYFTLGVYYNDVGESDKVVEFMEQAIELDPSNAIALNYLGYTLVELDTRLKEAVLYIERAIEIDPKNGYFIDSLGWAYYKLSQYKQAAKSLEEAVLLVPDDAVILEHLAIVQFKNGNVARALEVAEQASEFVSDSEDKQVGERLKSLIKKLENQLAQE